MESPQSINDAGLALIKQFEGCRLQAYKDVIGVLTIGYGHTGGDVFEGQEISQDGADGLLRADLCKFERGVSDLVDNEISSNQFSALVCFAYNVGLNNLKHSTLLAKTNAGDFDGAAQEFVKWDHAGGKVMDGLLRRREAERDLYLS